MMVVAVMVIVATVAAVSIAVLVVVHVDTGLVPMGRARVSSMITRAVRAGRLRQHAQQAKGSGTNRKEDGGRPS